MQLSDVTKSSISPFSKWSLSCCILLVSLWIPSCPDNLLYSLVCMEYLTSSLVVEKKSDSFNRGKYCYYFREGLCFRQILNVQTLDHLLGPCESCFRESETDLFLGGVAVCFCASYYGVLSRQGWLKVCGGIPSRDTEDGVTVRKNRGLKNSDDDTTVYILACWWRYWIRSLTFMKAGRGITTIIRV